MAGRDPAPSCFEGLMHDLARNGRARRAEGTLALAGTGYLQGMHSPGGALHAIPQLNNGRRIVLFDAIAQ